MTKYSPDVAKIPLMSNWMWLENRRKDILSMVKLYAEEERPIPEEWVEEYLYILKWERENNERR